MPENAEAEWARYCVGQVVDGEQCCEMRIITHTTHVQQAVDIVRSGTLTAGLVFDESKLKRYRIRVVWLSPNYWHPGFRYGSIQFHFHVSDVIEGMHAYYVETAQYNTPAPRILLSERDRGKILTPYDPDMRNGPWWHNTTNGKHYYNGRYTLEMMRESDLHLESATKIEFVKHHDSFCSIHPNTPASCKEVGCEPYRAGSYFIARIVGEKLAARTSELLTKDSEPSSPLQRAWNFLEKQLKRLPIDFAGRIKADHDSAPALSRAVLRAYGARDSKDLKALSALFKARDELMQALQACVESAFELREGALSEDS